jgi:excisionase family DNA binding protein
VTPDELETLAMKVADRIGDRVAEVLRGSAPPQPRANSKKLMTVKECADLLCSKPDAIYKMVERGQLPVVRIRKRILFDVDEMNRFLAKSQVAVIDPASPGRGRRAR